MLIMVLVWSLLALSCLYASFAGGTSGRIGAALMVTATVATLFAEQLSPWSHTQIAKPIGQSGPLAFT
jgi:hypothetical protein